MIRLFVALQIPEEIRSLITFIRKSIYSNDDNLRWENDSKIHLTLKFIGEVKETLLMPIEDELRFLESYPKINCATEKFGFFFNEKKEPRILWLGLIADNTLKLIVDELNIRLSKFSIPIEKRKFKAHVTLLRIRGKVPEGFTDKFIKAEFNHINFVSNEIALMQSTLSSQSSTYKEIKKYILK